ncbi:MAG: lycopene beta-cyclase CrtY [Myxococcales bacterium]|jgi:lycopene beta-cyclase
MPADTHENATEFDLLLVGGGLANGLIALAALARDPGLSVAIVERGERLGGNHTWCLHPEDAPAAARGFLQPLLVHRWQGYEVRFPGLKRELTGEYAAVTSERFDAVVRDAMSKSDGSRLLLGRSATTVDAQRVELDDGTELRGRLVVDARGPDPQATLGRAGYQKFLGLELEMTAPHGATRPLLMDATVEQTDGFRFMYVLPLSPTRLLVEDTTFSRSPELDESACRDAALRYGAHYGGVREVVRDERGVLPMTFRSDDPPHAEKAPPLLAGYRGGFCHPATGYSFPVALRLALHVADRGPDAAVGPALSRLRREHRSQARYAEHLNWLLFHCFEPKDMWNVFERFYRLPEPLVHRFYAMNMTRTDRARILMGKPPRGISLKTALAAGSAP